MAQATGTLPPARPPARLVGLKVASRKWRPCGAGRLPSGALCVPLIQFVMHLHDHKKIVRDDGGEARLVDDFDEKKVTLPEGVENVVMSRIDNLTARQSAFLKMMSVIGMPPFAICLPSDAGHFRHALACLVRPGHRFPPLLTWQGPFSCCGTPRTASGMEPRTPGDLLPTADGQPLIAGGTHVAQWS